MYRIQLQQFEGPLDLLLFFIRRDELDIHDIPISRITDEYLEYVRLLEEIDLDGVADFIYMAAILIGIKAKMLLPRPELDEEGEPIDPRAELIQRLLEYMRFKEGADHLEACHEERAERFVRGAASAAETTPTGEPTYRASVFDLITALKRVLDNAPGIVPLHPVRRYEYTVDEQKEYLIKRIQIDGKASFVDLVGEAPRPFVVTTFLAVLDLVQRHLLRIIDGATPDDFHLTLGAPPDVHPSLGEAVATTAGRTDEVPANDAAARVSPRPAADRPALRPFSSGRPSDG
jgi:segregation and condensation protein A